ncbi:MAG: glycosyltransferase family 4 protein [Bacteroidota bacterium]
MKTILITAYAINPYKGSEDGTGWNWVKHLARYYRVIAITRENNLPPIRQYLAEQAVPYADRMEFVGFDLPKKLRFWKRGSFGALPYFVWWEKSLPKFIQQSGLEFDLAHHLNFHNDWTPSYLWKLGKPWVWGPIGHHPAVPKAYITPFYGWKAWAKDRLRWGIKKAFWHGSPALRSSARQASRILTMNSSVEKVLPLDADKCFRMPQVGAAEPVLTEDLEDEGIFQILTVGRFVPIKGIDLAILAYARFFQQLNPLQKSRVRLTIVGKGPWQAALQDLAASFTLGNSLRFVSWMPQEDLRSLYQQSQVFLFPSHEGAGMVVPEAFSYGLPVVCLNNIGPGEFVTPQSGIKVPGGTYQETADQLASALGRLYASPTLLTSLKQGAKTRFDQWFNWEVKAALIHQLYEEILEEAPYRDRSFTEQLHGQSPGLAT